MIIKTLLVGFGLQFLSIDELQKPGWHYTYYESVRFEVWGTLEIDLTGKGQNRVKWDTRHPVSWRNYLEAREKQAKTPVPYGVT